MVAPPLLVGTLKLIEIWLFVGVMEVIVGADGTTGIVVVTDTIFDNSPSPTELTALIITW